MTALGLSLMAFCVSVAAVLVLRPVCFYFGHVDHPGGRKRHDLATPLSGGLAISLSILALGWGIVPNRHFSGFAVGLIVLLLLGGMDDRKHVPASLRLALQTIAVTVGMYWLGDVRLEDLGAITGGDNVRLGDFSLLFTVFAAVGIINAVNMIDGMDGLAGGFSALLISVILALASGTAAVSIVMLCLTIGSIFGFLAFNLRTPWHRQARIFLGDAGSLVLGYILVWFAIEASQEATSIIRPITAVWLFGLPLMDTCYLMGSRVLRGKSPLAADRYHFHHLLQRSGFTPGWALYIWLIVAGGFMAAGVCLQWLGAPDVVLCIGFVVTFAAYCLTMNILWRRRSARRSRLRRWLKTPGS